MANDPYAGIGKPIEGQAPPPDPYAGVGTVLTPDQYSALTPPAQEAYKASLPKGGLVGTDNKPYFRDQSGNVTEGFAPPTLGSVGAQGGQGVLEGIQGLGDTLMNAAPGVMADKFLNMIADSTDRIAQGINGQKMSPPASIGAAFFGPAPDIQAPRIPAIAGDPRNLPEKIARVGGNFAPGIFAGPEAEAGMIPQILQRGMNVALPALGSAAGSAGVKALGGGQDMQDAGSMIGGAAFGLGGNLRLRPSNASANLPLDAGAASPVAINRAASYLAPRLNTPNRTMIAAHDAGIPTILAQRAGATNILRSLARQPGATNQALMDYAGSGTTPDPALRGQIGDFPNRAQTHFHDVTGVSPAAAGGDMEALTEDLRAKDDGVRAAYDAALYNPGKTPKAVTMTPELATVLQESEVQKALAFAKRRVGSGATIAGIAVDPATGAQMIDPHTKAPVIEHQPTAETLDLTKKYLGQLVKRDQSGQPITSGDAGVGNDFLDQHRAALTDALAGTDTIKPAIGGYREALDKAGDVLSMGHAFNFGRDNVFNSRMSGPVWDKYVANLSDADKAAHQAGVANAVNLIAEKGQISPKSFTPSIVQGKLASTYGPDAAATIAKRMGMEGENLATLRDAIPRGQTSTATDMAERSAQDGGPGIFTHLVTAAALAPISREMAGGYLLSQAVPRIKGAVLSARQKAFGMPVEARDIAGQLLLHPSITPEQIQAYAASQRPRLGLNTGGLIPQTERLGLLSSGQRP